LEMVEKSLYRKLMVQKVVVVAEVHNDASKRYGTSYCPTFFGTERTTPQHIWWRDWLAKKLRKELIFLI
jgi:hypothetical protein